MTRWRMLERAEALYPLTACAFIVCDFWLKYHQRSAMASEIQAPQPHAPLTRLGLSAWRAESVRITGFFAAPVFPSLDEAITWYTALAGEAPEAATTQPKDNVHQLQGIVTLGATRSHLTLTVSVFRYDWNLMATPEGDPQAGLGPFDETIIDFLERAERWIANSPPLDRLALGAVATMPTTDRTAGYKQLAAYLPFSPDPTASDFLYQINHPRSSQTVPNQFVNCLMKWSVGSKSHFKISIGPEGTVPSGPSTRSVHCRAEFDINTTPDRAEPLEMRSLAGLLQEFAEICRELLLQGDTTA